MSVPRNRILALMETQSRIFNTVFNPSGARQGTKILHQRLKGPSVAAYYPRRIGTFGELARLYPEWEGLNIDEWHREEKIAGLKARGKGAPKKKRTAPEATKHGQRKRK
ncbi:uncharacterized protein K452DRAFT_307699 [Aplosporella prunicola CBS 121167]|uniref:Small ribosomal subunit protein mS33 n=1 Tax=Aplosporella prunicola CBS 121167 TaxID=1176127 RepID=A0A6A6BF42_9PEZI|nr:uncharacterized protein K452DRAFT_307699 [Aplosporella prunicola CBS 121167]KAF2142780.1 hypothetical protein K452DRAFT_307699 [Aplosporella prunicola CBS 121167]